MQGAVEAPDERSRDLSDSPNSEEAARAARTLDEAIGRIQSEADAEQVLDEIARETKGETQHMVERTDHWPDLPAHESIVAAVEQAPAEQKPVAALEATVEQTTTEQLTPEEVALAQAIRHRMIEPGDRLKPHRYLQEAALKRMSLLQAWDASLFISVNHLPHKPYLIRFMSAISTVFMHGAGWVGCALLLTVFNRRKGGRTLLDLVPSLLLADVLIEQVVKKYFRRRRPFITLVKALVVGRKPGSWSFPSGHAATSFACANILSWRYRAGRPFFYAVASIVAFSRVYLGHHYPSDVLSGATLGEGTSRVVTFVLGRALRGR